MENINLNFSIEREELNAEEYINYCKKILLLLQSMDSVFKNANIVDIDNRKNYHFQNDLSDFNTENLKLIITEQKDIVYINPDSENKNLTHKSHSWMGFSSTIFFGGSDDIESRPDVSINFSQGASDSIPATIKLHYSSHQQHKLSDEYIFALFELVAKIIKLKSANAISSKFFSKVRRKGKCSVGWINYTINKGILNFLKSPEKAKELNDGVVFSICEKDVFNSDASELINRAMEISDFLNEVE